jgi:hypothetical protein
VLKKGSLLIGEDPFFNTNSLFLISKWIWLRICFLHLDQVLVTSVPCENNEGEAYSSRAVGSEDLVPATVVTSDCLARKE